MNQTIVDADPHGGVFKNDVQFVENLKEIVSSKLQFPLDVDWWFYRVNAINCCVLDFCDVKAHTFSIIIHITGRLLATDVSMFDQDCNHIEIEVCDTVDAIFISQQILHHFNVASLMLESDAISFYRHRL